MREIIQLVVSFTGSLGFAALFNIHGKKLWFAALGGCLSWAVYLAVEFITPSPYVCGFWSTVAITLYAECMARIPGNDFERIRSAPLTSVRLMIMQEYR